MSTRYGYISITDPEKGTLEFDAFLCCHCQRVCIVQPPAPGSQRMEVFVAPIVGMELTRTEQQGFVSEPRYCQSCDAHTCGRKECVESCIPVEAKLEFLEGSRREWRQTEITGW